MNRPENGVKFPTVQYSIIVLSLPPTSGVLRECGQDRLTGVNGRDTCMRIYVEEHKLSSDGGDRQGQLLLFSLPVLTVSVWAEKKKQKLAARQWRDEVGALTCSFL